MNEAVLARLFRVWVTPFMPLLALILVTGIGSLFQKSMLAIFLAVPPGQRGAASSFAAVSWLLLMVQGAAIIIALYLLCSGGTDRSRRLVGLLLALLACVAVLLFPDDNYMPETMRQLERIALKCPSIIDLVVRQEQTGLCAAALLTLSVCVLLNRTWPEDREEQAKILAERMQLLSVILYTGTILLVASVLRTAALNEWIVTSNKDLAAQTAGELRVWGVFYTTLLAAIFLPTYFLFRQRAEQVAGEEATPTAREEWLAKRGLKLSLPEALPRILAILGPILAGEASKLLHVFS